MSDAIIRPAVKADLPAVQACLRETWHATYDAMFGAAEVTQFSDRLHALGVLEQDLASPDAAFLVADCAGAIVGTVYAYQTEPGQLILARLYVRTHMQSRGLGRRLLAAALANFAAIDRVRLEVAAKNAAAIGFYEAQGFTRSPTQAHGHEAGASHHLVYEKHWPKH